MNYISICCTAYPLYDLHEDEHEPIIGICSHCREHTAFELEKETE